MGLWFFAAPSDVAGATSPASASGRERVGAIRVAVAIVAHAAALDLVTENQLEQLRPRRASQPARV